MMRLLITNGLNGFETILPVTVEIENKLFIVSDFSTEMCKFDTFFYCNRTNNIFRVVDKSNEDHKPLPVPEKDTFMTSIIFLFLCNGWFGLLILAPFFSVGCYFFKSIMQKFTIVQEKTLQTFPIDEKF